MNTSLPLLKHRDRRRRLRRRRRRLLRHLHRRRLCHLSGVGRNCY